MKNKFIIIIFYLITHLFYLNTVKADESFNFDVTEVQIIDDGNKFIGKKRGKITTDSGIILDADSFEYDKILNILKANGNVVIQDTIDNSFIYTNRIKYLKNKEKIFTYEKSKAIKNEIVIDANEFEYDKNLNIIKANGDVKIEDQINDTLILSQRVIYLKDKEEIYTEGFTESFIESKYNFKSKNVVFKKNEMELSSNYRSTITDDDDNLYKLKNFVYFINDKLLKGKNVKITSKHGQIDSDNFYFSHGFFNFKNNSFTAKDTKILLHSNVFKSEREKFLRLENDLLNQLFGDEFSQNDPRIIGASSQGDEKKTIINKAVYTSCKKNNGCPAWSITSEKVTHDKIKKQLIYDNSILKILDTPVFYFPKFFHPDPTVKRQSGFLRPQLNNTKNFGSSIYLPYYHVISENKDYTFKPTIFQNVIKGKDNNIIMLQNEYRQKNEFSSFITDFSLTKGYKSDLKDSNENSIIHLFSKFDLDLNLDNFLSSKFELKLEKVNNDNYLTLFQNNLSDTKLKPSSNGELTSKADFYFDHENFDLSAGISINENLGQSNNDRYQYVFPYYSFNTTLFPDLDGSVNFSSGGSSTLQDTNNVKTSIVNNLSYSSSDFISNLGSLTKFGAYFKNLNSLGKNDNKYKSSPQMEGMSIFEVSTSYPLVKLENNYFSTLTPKISIRASPNSMKNYSSEGRSVNASSIFSINRLALGDTFEAGKSLVLGIDYKKENTEDIEKYLEAKLATNFRDKTENSIPTSSTLGKKNSDYFGSIDNRLSKNVKIGYNFQTENDLKTFNYHSINTELSLNNFVTEFTYSESRGIVGEANVIGNTTSVKFNDNNFLTFNTRRNREINLTEYYDLVYEYKNDCLTAGIKYKKTYYSNDTVRPTEDLMFTLTLFPLTTFEQEVDQNFYRNTSSGKIDFNN